MEKKSNYWSLKHWEYWEETGFQIKKITECQSNIFGEKKKVSHPEVWEWNFYVPIKKSLNHLKVENFEKITCKLSRQNHINSSKCMKQQLPGPVLRVSDSPVEHTGMKISMLQGFQIILMLFFLTKPCTTRNSYWKKELPFPFASWCEQFWLPLSKIFNILKNSWNKHTATTPKQQPINSFTKL